MHSRYPSVIAAVPFFSAVLIEVGGFSRLYSGRQRVHCLYSPSRGTNGPPVSFGRQGPHPTQSPTPPPLPAQAALTKPHTNTSCNLTVAGMYFIGPWCISRTLGTHRDPAAVATYIARKNHAPEKPRNARSTEPAPETPGRPGCKVS